MPSILLPPRRLEEDLIRLPKLMGEWKQLYRRKDGIYDLRLLCSGPGRLCHGVSVTIIYNELPLDQAPYQLFSQKCPIKVEARIRIGIPRSLICPGALLLRDRALSAGRYNGDLSAMGSLPSTPSTILTWVLAELRRSLIGITATGVLRLVRPARFAPWLWFGDTIQKRKAAPQHGANRINSHVREIAQAEIADIATGAMLSLSIGSIVVGKGALRRQA